jgi:hypothetical protein
MTFWSRENQKIKYGIKKVSKILFLGLNDISLNGVPKKEKYVFFFF